MCSLTPLAVTKEMLLCIGQEKALCAPPASPMELGTGERIVSADLNKWGLQTGVQHNRELQTEVPVIPSVESGDQIKG